MFVLSCVNILAHPDSELRGIFMNLNVDFLVIVLSSGITIGESCENFVGVSGEIQPPTPFCYPAIQDALHQHTGTTSPVCALVAANSGAINLWLACTFLFHIRCAIQGVRNGA